jgi:hypothetical protein
MFKKKTLPILAVFAIIVLLVTSTAVFADNSQKWFGDESAATPHEKADFFDIKNSSIEPYNQESNIKDYYFKLTEEQAKSRYEILKQNPDISEGDLLLKVAPDAVNALPAEFINRLRNADANINSSSDEPVTYLRSVLGPFKAGWSGTRKVTNDEDGNISFGPLNIKESEKSERMQLDRGGPVHVSAEIIVSTFLYIPPNTTIGYELGNLLTDGWWSWDSSKVTSISGRDTTPWTNTMWCWFVHSGPILFQGPCITPADYCYWYGNFDYKKTENCQQGGVISHTGGVESGIYVFPDGEWYCWYDNWGGPPGKQLEYRPASGWYQE